LGTTSGASLRITGPNEIGTRACLCVDPLGLGRTWRCVRIVSFVVDRASSTSSSFGSIVAGLGSRDSGSKSSGFVDVKGSECRES
jgi:hypothetical protein